MFVNFLDDSRTDSISEQKTTVYLHPISIPIYMISQILRRIEEASS